MCDQSYDKVGELQGSRSIIIVSTKSQKFVNVRYVLFYLNLKTTPASFKIYFMTVWKPCLIVSKSKNYNDNYRKRKQLL